VKAYRERKALEARRFNVGGVEDVFDYRSDAQVRHEEAERVLAASNRERRDGMSEHGRALEDVVDEYTAAVKDGTTQEFFERVAADRVERARLSSVERAMADRERKILFAAREMKDDLEEFFHAVEVADATQKKGD